MPDPYLPLKSKSVTTIPNCFEPDLAHDMTHLEQPALAVFNDFHKYHVLKMLKCTPIDIAMQQMLDAEQKVCLVINSNHELEGILSSHDIAGEKPFKVMREEGKQRADVLVGEIMIPLSQLHCIDYASIKDAKVGQIMETLRQTHSEHMLVTACTTKEEQIMGVFSAQEITKQIDIYFEPRVGVKSFAEFANNRRQYN